MIMDRREDPARRRPRQYGGSRSELAIPRADATALVKMLFFMMALMGLVLFSFKPAQVHAAEMMSDGIIEEVVVTGSAIKRADLDGALPVQIFTRADIDRTNVATTEDLVDKMPAMQGYLTASDSVGGGGGGVRGASIRGLGEEYTLVLLNGRRLAPADSGATIDLQMIPLSMLEQVELLTDGASALYGSDAIAGVVNYKLRQDVEKTQFSIRASDPLEGAGEELDFDVIGGYGSFEDDGFSVVFAYNRHEQSQLKATDRTFAETGILTITEPNSGNPALFFNGSGNSIPGNARITYTDPALVDEDNLDGENRITFNPYREVSGECAPNTSQIGEECWFDYTSTIEIIPESERNSFFVNTRIQLDQDIEAFGTLVYSDNSLTSRIAPYPSGWVRIPNDAELVVNEVLPHLTDVQLDGLQTVDGRWRGLPAGNRTQEFNSQALHAVVGLDATFGEFDFNMAISHSKNEQEENFPTGWLIRESFQNALAEGAFNIFAPASEFSDEDFEALAPSIYSGNWTSTEVTVTTVDFVAARPLIEMGGGESELAFGIDYRTTDYDRAVADANAREELLFLSKSTPYDMDRDQWGIFVEYLMPIFDNFEVNLAVRHDEISAISRRETRGFDENGEDVVAVEGGGVGEDLSDTTYKISARWDVNDLLAVRASYGTGFKAPTQRQIAEPQSEFGVTSGNYPCPFSDGSDLEQACLTGESQYGVYREGSAGLEPETSTQFTLGVVVEPDDYTSVVLDYWSIEIENIVERLTEQQIFNNAETYRHLFRTRLNQSTMENELAIIQAAVNAGTYDGSGIDYKLSRSFDLPFGTLSTAIAGTHTLESESSLTGSSLGRFGNNNEVTFKHRYRFEAVLDHGRFTHSLSWNFRTGYTDAAQTVNIIQNGEPDYANDTPVQLSVPSYYTIDLQSRAMLMDDQLEVTLGIENLLDEEPPLSLRTSGSGHQVGWDPRYVDAYLRTVTLKATYSL